MTEGNALEATGHRLKPCGYYGLHRKGPIDLEPAFQQILKDIL